MPELTLLPPLLFCVTAWSLVYIDVVLLSETGGLKSRNTPVL